MRLSPILSCAMRRSSVTAVQSLELYNGEFVNSEAQHFARRVRDTSSDDRAEQIHCAFQIALSREPTSDGKSEKVLTLQKTSESNEDLLVGLCRILLNLNEFVYID